MVKYISSYEKISTIILSVMVGAVLASMAVLLSSSASADSTSANATVTVGSACTMTATVDPAHTAEVPAGSTKTNIGSTTLNTICNDAGGYAIYAVGYSGDEYGNNKMLNGTNEINTGTGTSASNWNMSLSQVTTGTYATTIDGGFGSYSAIPATYTKVAHRDSMTDSTTGSSINLTYGAYVASTQAPGDYVGKVKFTMVHPATEVPPQPVACASGRICYNPNGTNVIGTMGSPNIASSATSATLLASNFSRKGYGFAGWNTEYDYSGTFYGPQEDITFTAGQYTGNNDGLSLYAIWVKTAGSLQDSNKVSSICSNLVAAPTDGTANLSSVSALTDQRDNQTYAIAKLADSKCWMIENLRLENVNSDNSTGTLAQGYGTSATYGNFGGLADAEGTGFSSTYTANSLYYSGTQEGTASIDIGTTDLPAYRMPRYNNWNNQSISANRPQNPTTNSATNSTTNAGLYSYGNYYTWHAAIADLTHNNTSNSSVTNTSLCPVGWHLPTGGGVTTSVNVAETPSTWREFYNLGYSIMGSEPNQAIMWQHDFYNRNLTNSAGKTAPQAFRSFPNNFLWAGYFTGSSTYDRGNASGQYWSSTTYAAQSSFYMLIGTGGLYPGTTTIYKYYGASIRCVAGS